MREHFEQITTGNNLDLKVHQTYSAAVPSAPGPERLYPVASINDFTPRSSVPLLEHNYKINQIILEHRFLCREIDKRKLISKKYSKATTILECAKALLIGGEISITAISAALHVLMPILPIIAVMTGVGVGCRYIAGYMSKKKEKHFQLKVLAESKVKSIEGKFAKALKDGVVTDEEYETILNEVRLYKEFLERSKAEVLTEKKKKELIEVGRNEVLSAVQRGGVGNSYFINK